MTSVGDDLSLMFINMVKLPPNKYKLSFWASYWVKNNVEKLKSHNEYGCNKANTDTLKNFYCGRLIELNNRKIPDNYPW